MGTISTVAREDILSRLRKLPIQTVCLDEAQVPLEAKISLCNWPLLGGAFWREYWVVWVPLLPVWSSNWECYIHHRLPQQTASLELHEGCLPSCSLLPLICNPHRCLREGYSKYKSASWSDTYVLILHNRVHVDFARGHGDLVQASH